MSLTQPDVSKQSLPAQTRAILTDSHFWVPAGVLIAGIILLVVLH